MLLNQAGGEETKKGLGAGEEPSEMGLASSTEHNFPAISGKPSELSGRLAAWQNPGSLTKAAQYKGDSRRIEKGMFVPVITL